MDSTNVLLIRTSSDDSEPPYADMFHVPAEIINQSCDDTAVMALFRRIAEDYVRSHRTACGTVMPAGWPFTISDFVGIPDSFLDKYGVQHQSPDPMLHVLLSMGETMAYWPDTAPKTTGNPDNDTPSLRDALINAMTGCTGGIDCPPELVLQLTQGQLWSAQNTVINLIANLPGENDIAQFAAWNSMLLQLNAISDKLMRDSMNDLYRVMAVIPQDLTAVQIKLLQVMKPLEQGLDGRSKRPPETAKAVYPRLDALRKVTTAEPGIPINTLAALNKCADNISVRMDILRA